MRSALAALAAVALPCFVAVPAHSDAAALPAAVTVANMSFGPSRVTVAVGETVTWTFQDSTNHTATSDNGFFNTGPASGGATRTVRFRSAGTFAYHCMIHPTMVGRVGVPVAATGSVEDGWRLRWLAGDNPKNRAYDVQVRRKDAATWTSFRKATTSATGRFDPGKGTWQVRARTFKGAAKSGWSPVRTLTRHHQIARVFAA